jgi:hypothetical protein
LWKKKERICVMAQPRTLGINWSSIDSNSE